MQTMLISSFGRKKFELNTHVIVVNILYINLGNIEKIIRGVWTYLRATNFNICSFIKFISSRKCYRLVYNKLFSYINEFSLFIS